MSTRRTPLLLLWLALLAATFLACSGDGGQGDDAATPDGDEQAAETAAESSSDSESGTAEGGDASGNDGESSSGNAESATKKPRKERATSVDVAEVQRRDLVLPVLAEGSVRARHTSNITFELTGRVTKVWVREGQRVRKGQKLVSLDDRELRLELEEARSRYLQGLGQLAVEEDGYSNSSTAERVLDERRAQLADQERRGEITREERLERELDVGMTAVREGAYRRELIEVRSGLAAARADQARLQIQLERTEVRAPFSGVISGLELDPGEHVQVGQTLARLVDDVNLEAAVGVLESDLGNLEVGQRALLELPALGRTVPVTVDVIDAEVAADSRTCRVLLRLRSEDRRIKPGMFVRASIAGEVYPDRLLVPREAIVTRDGRPVLFRVEDGRAQWVYVQLGNQNETSVEIARVTQGGPLEPDTQVIVSNHLTLTHEAKIKVKKTVELADPWAAPAEAE